MYNRCWYLLSKKLSGNAIDAELSELDDLLLQHPEWQYAVQHVSTIWASSTMETADEEVFIKHVRRMESLGHETTMFNEPGAYELRAQSTFPKKKWATVGTILGSLIAIVCWFVFNQNKPTALTVNSSAVPNNKIITKSGDRSKMVLPDGTQVWLNAESKLEYNKDYGKNNRDVTLSGEAYFDVVKNTEIPFTIQTDRIHIKVTGTAFNVKAYPGEKVSETSLVRGRVEVTVNARPDEKYILKPNEKLVVRDEIPAAAVNKNVLPLEDKKANEPLIQLGYLNYVDNDSAAIETSWVYNRLIFDDESFGEIAKKMERWYGVNISMEDARVGAQHMTYTIRNETIAQALRNMQYALRFHYTINGNNIVVTK
jgi:transmembrane sensor